MIKVTLDLPDRTAKPRLSGITMMIDGGLSSSFLTDVISSAGEYIDLVKFGWGTALVTHDLDRKVDVLVNSGTPFYFGGTLFEKYIHQDRFDEYRDLCHACSCTYVEVSNGTIDLPNSEKALYIRKLADEFVVLSEVGFKDPTRSENLFPLQWVDYVHEDLDSGSTLVTMEARESGRSGICRPDGELRYGLIEELLSSGIPPERLLFEAPNGKLQTYFIKRLGPNVNLGNVAATDVIGLETLRLGLRADTLLELG